MVLVGWLGLAIDNPLSQAQQLNRPETIGAVVLGKLNDLFDMPRVAYVFILLCVAGIARRPSDYS